MTKSTTKYNHKAIEEKWQKHWEREKLFCADDNSRKKRFYSLIEFPYPSGDGIHVGHIRSNTAMDIIARKRKMEGYNVLYPIGWDAFGLPTENYAVKTGIHPSIVTKQNTDTFRRQLKSIGFAFDWSREINTTDPNYYKWTQWIFIQFFKHGLAYKSKMPINWCLSCKIGLANEEVVDGKCERCGGDTEKREKEQWMLAITKYADRLDKDLDDVDYLPRIKTQQRNWIGKSEGAEIEFSIKGQESRIKVFTTRPDTIAGVTYLVLAPEHPFVREQISSTKSQITNKSEIQKYLNQSRKKTEIERTAEGKEKTGVELDGVTAINPWNGEGVPVWIADYVLTDYGTGAIMAVPQHDERDRAFAETFGLEIVDRPLVEHGAVIKKTGAIERTVYKLRDWVFSRQRYWGEPIPMVYCETCKWVPVPEEQLPIELPKVKEYAPTDDGESPLATMTKWLTTTCPTCGGTARRETDTMPNWAGSSWYYWAYLILKDFIFQNPKGTPSGQIQSTKFKTQLKQWLPVDWYNGGMEHTTLHLLYSRFWHKFLHDIKVVPGKEPYAKRTSHGMVLAEGLPGQGGVKMSKSKGNVINPDDIVSVYGADTLRVYEMFMGPFDQAIVWNTGSLGGAHRFLERVWKLQYKVVEKTKADKETVRTLHTTIKKVDEDIETMKFNTAISQLMILVNGFESEESIQQKHWELFLTLLSPFAPHIAEELWNKLGHKKSILLEKWPKYDAKKIAQDSITLIVQVNGKVRDMIKAPINITEKEAVSLARKSDKVQMWIPAKAEVKKIVFVPKRLINLVS